MDEKGHLLNLRKEVTGLLPLLVPHIDPSEAVEARTAKAVAAADQSADPATLKDNNAGKIS